MGAKRKSVWGGAVRPCMSRVASPPSRVNRFVCFDAHCQPPDANICGNRNAIIASYCKQIVYQTSPQPIASCSGVTFLFFALGIRQKQIAAKAKLLMRSLAHIGIIALVDEATGYQGVRPKDALQMYLEKIIRKELAAWAKKFPDEFYENIYKLKNWPWPGMKKNRYSVVAHYTRNLVYERLATGLLKELEAKSPKNDSGNRPNKLHQWLTEDIGDPLLAQHLHSVIMFQRLAISSGFGIVF